MIYECCFYGQTREFLCARAQGWPWSYSERQTPFVVIDTSELSPRESDYPVDLALPWGTVDLQASQIDPTLVTEENHG